MLEMSGASSPEFSNADTQEPPGSKPQEATSPLFDSERDGDDLSFNKDPQDCITTAGVNEADAVGINCKSFESSVQINSVSAKSGECASSSAEVENPSPIDSLSNDGGKELQQCDAEDSSDLEFDEDKFRDNLGMRNSVSVPTKIQDLRASCRKKPMQNVRRNTDGGLAFNLRSATAAASATINASKNIYSTGRSSMGHFRQRSVNSLEAPSVELQTCYQRLRHRLYEFINSTHFCSPLKRYSKTRSMIQVMENQCFVPPPSDGVTFWGTLINAAKGFGVDFVMWVNQSSFLTALVLFLSSYYTLVCIFAGILVHMENKHDGKCLDIDETLWTLRENYELAFELSWTTFTTVGYGQVSPSGYEYGCYSTRVLCASFAFMGLLFNSLSAAVFFSKLESFLTKSSVIFSSSACIQHRNLSSARRASNYGQFMRRTDSLTDMGMGSSGNIKSSQKNSSLFTRSSTRLSDDVQDDKSESENQNLVLRAARLSRRLPYPFLEFRIVNGHANYKKREIRNAHVSAMVQLTPADAESITDRNLTVTQLHREYVTPAPSHHSSQQSDDMNSKNTSATETADTAMDTKTNREAALTRTNSSFMHLPVAREDSGTGQQIGPEGRVYLPLKLEPSSHPYFKRVYYVHHVLDDKSPLLKPSVRLKIKNGWDPSLSTYQDIRESLVDCRKIRIIFKGNSAVNNSMVFAEKVYTLEDIFVGWQFGNIFYRREKWRWWKRRRKSNDDDDMDQGDIDDDDLVLDKRLIHDIFPQKNASSEPLQRSSC